MEKKNQPKPEKEQLRGILRISGTDLKGEKKVFPSLQKIKGVGTILANIICNISGIERTKLIGHLTDQEIKKIQDIIDNPKKHNIPDWAMNRRADPKTGKTIHVSGPNLKFTQEQDIKSMMAIKSYRGVRHSLGLPVRGQRTRSSFRKGRAVGVVKKKEQPKKKKK